MYKINENLSKEENIKAAKKYAEKAIELLNRYYKIKEDANELIPLRINAPKKETSPNAVIEKLLNASRSERNTKDVYCFMEEKIRKQKMNGGRFDYKQYDIIGLIVSIKAILEGEEDREFGREAIEIDNNKVKEKLEEALIILKAAFIYTERIDWLLSGDDDEYAFFKRLEENFSDERINLSIDRVNGKAIIQLFKDSII